MHETVFLVELRERIRFWEGIWWWGRHDFVYVFWQGRGRRHYGGGGSCLPFLLLVGAVVGRGRDDLGASAGMGGADPAPHFGTEGCPAKSHDLASLFGRKVFPNFSHKSKFRTNARQIFCVNPVYHQRNGAGFYLFATPKPETMAPKTVCA